MKVVMLLTKGRDCDDIYSNVNNYVEILEKLCTFFDKNKDPGEDLLVTEIVLYQVDYFKLLMLHNKLHEFLTKYKIVDTLIYMLDVHTEINMVKAISGAIQDAVVSSA